MSIKKLPLADLETEKDIGSDLCLGKAQALERLYALYYESLCRYVLRFIPDPLEAEEIVQQCMLNLWESREKASEIKSFKSYLYRSVYNLAMNKIKHDKVKQAYVSETEQQLYEAYMSDYEETLELEMMQELQQEIEQLPDKNKRVFKLRFFSGYTTNEVSEELGITPRTVETHVSNALKILRKAFMGYEFVIFLLGFFTWF